MVRGDPKSIRNSSLLKNTGPMAARGIEITDYDSLIPFGTAESATKIAQENLDNSDIVV